MWRSQESPQSSLCLDPKIQGPVGNSWPAGCCLWLCAVTNPECPEGPTSKDEEGCAVRDEAGLVMRQSIGNGSHAMLTNSKAEVALLVCALLEIPKGLHQGHVAGSQICGSSHEPWNE